MYNHHMPEYRRALIKGGTYFLTLVTYQRQDIFASAAARSLLNDAIHQTQNYNPFMMIAHCILPDHIHFIWQLPEDDADYSTRISVLKRRFSRNYVAQFGLPMPKDSSRVKRREVTLWQRRFWEHLIRDEEDLNRHIDYVHFNPVKHGLVNRVGDWAESSFFDYVDMGYYDVDWGGRINFDDQNDQFGE
jgi:putative transposase